MTDNGTGDALDLIQQAAADKEIEGGAGLPSRNATVIDEAASKIGLRTGEFVGLPDQYRPSGVGDAGEIYDYASRSIAVHPASVGAGVVAPLPSRGAIDTRASLVRLFRVASNEHDAADTFATYRDAGTADFSFGGGDYRRVAGLEFNVKVPAGKRAILKAEAWLDGLPVNSSTSIDVVLCLGAEGVRVGNDYPLQYAANLTGSDSRSLPIGGADGRHQLTHRHGRLIEGTDLTETAGVPCFVKVKQIASGGGGGGTGTTARFSPGNPVQTTAAVNMRSSTNANADNVIVTLSKGANGTVNSGPATGSGFTWWNCTFGANSGWVVEDYLRRTTTDAPQPTTSTIRGAFLIVERIPV